MYPFQGQDWRGFFPSRWNVAPLLELDLSFVTRKTCPNLSSTWAVPKWRSAGASKTKISGFEYLAAQDPILGTKVIRSL